MSDQDATPATPASPSPATAAALDQSIQDALSGTATRLAGADAATLVSPVLVSTIMDLFTNLITSCFNKPAPGPSPAPTPTPAAVAAQIKGMSGVQQSILRNRARRHVVQQGMSREQGNLAGNTLVTVAVETPQDHLATAVAHLQEADAAFPSLDMF